MIYNYAHLNANGATTLAPGQVALHSVTINAKGTAANTLTLSDGANVIAVIDTTANVGFLLFDVQCRAGLTAALATGTPADVTITFG